MEKLSEWLEETFEGEEGRELMEGLVGLGMEKYNKLKKQLITRGFVMGVLTTVSIYSIVVILMMLN